ncbi:MAG TPA: ABC transporter permease [Actinomycetota bacterium]|nr:ABC transporter permease [Actinomycetota bacterium]
MTPALAQSSELINWDLVANLADEIRTLTLQHIVLTVLAVAFGVVIAFPLSVVCIRRPRLYPLVTTVTGLLYTVPALALMVVLLPVLGLNIWPVVVALTIYTLLILIRNMVAGVRGVPADVRESAVGMGLTRRQVLWRVEIPLALPVILGGVRIATVSTIGLVTIGGLFGRGGLGQLIFDGLNRFSSTRIILGAGLSVLLALVADGLLLLLQRGLSPWARKAGIRTVAT